MNIEKLIERNYGREHFEKELDGEAHYSFWAKTEWETLFTTGRSSSSMFGASESLKNRSKKV